MKVAYRKEFGHILMDSKNGTRLTGLTFDDAHDLMFGEQLKYDRRKSFKRTSNRQWADGLNWT